MSQETISPAVSYRADIDGLRAVAVLAVVFCHLGLTALPGGFVGVDIFFVISGFLITGIIQREMAEGRFTFAQFYARRARRILPALLTVVLVTLPVAYFLFLPSELDVFALSALAAVGFAANFHFKDKVDYFDGVATDQPLLHIWSLAVEEQFYFLWPLLLLGLWKFLKPRSRLVVALVLFFASLIFSQWEVYYKPERTFYMLPARWWELMLGALIAMAGHQLKPGKHLATVLAWLGLALMLGSMFFLNENMRFPAFLALPVCLGAGLVIWVGQHRQGIVQNLLSTRPMVGIGKISYSLYLWHWPVLVIAAYCSTGPLSNSDLALIFAGSLVLAWLSWRYIEQPIRMARRRTLPTGKTLLLAGAAIVTVALIAWSGHLTKGWAWRVPPAVVETELKSREPNPLQNTCHNSRVTTVEQRLAGCTFGTEDTKAPYHIAVWGDSHADHYVPTFDLLARERGWRGLQFSTDACPPLMGVTRHLLRGKDCSIDFKNMMATIAAEPTIKLVVIAARWNAYAIPFFQDNRHGKKMTITDDKNELNDPVEIVAERLSDTVRFFNDRGIRVVLMGQVPAYERTPNICLLHKMWRGRDWAECNTEYPHALQDVADGNRAVRRAAEANPGTLAFFPTDLLCQGEGCQAYVNDVLIYRDDDHLNRHGAAALYQQLSLSEKLKNFKP